MKMEKFLNRTCLVLVFALPLLTCVACWGMSVFAAAAF